MGRRKTISECRKITIDIQPSSRGQAVERRLTNCLRCQSVTVTLLALKNILPHLRITPFPYHIINKVMMNIKEDHETEHSQGWPV